jgi:hypothetical protein
MMGGPGGPRGRPALPDPLAIQAAFDALKPVTTSDDQGVAIGMALSGEQVTDAALRPILPALRGMKRLTFTDTPITGATLVELGKLNDLKELAFTSVRITDVDLKALTGLKTLEKLDLDKTEVTDAGKDELQKELPGCKITLTK